MNRKKYYLSVLILLVFTAVSCRSAAEKEKRSLAFSIKNDQNLDTVSQMAEALIKTGFTAGSSYGEVWIRDYNTFIEVSCDVLPKQKNRENLLMFLKFQGDDGNIVDGFIPKDKTRGVAYDYIYTDKAPGFAVHKNTVETDQESSLVQAFYKYINKTGDNALLKQDMYGKTVIKRLQMAMDFLLEKRFSQKYGLLWGGTTADWGDVQPEHSWGVVLDENSHPAIDIYDNAMFVIALNDLIAMLDDKEAKDKWVKVRDSIKSNVRQYLWDEKRQKFIPHIYLKGSPFPEDFNENELYYFGGTAVAIEAGILTRDEIAESNRQMLENEKKAGAASIGLTIYPPYPQGFFKNSYMKPYSYQNGGDWTWFGGRMIQQLVKNGFVKEAYEEIQPMIERVIKNDGFYEWYTIDNKPSGSKLYRGSAGVLHKAIELLQQWAENKAE